MRGMRTAAATLAAVALAGTVGCSGPGGVSVSKDWGGVTGVVLASVSGQRTVVGIDTAHNRARSLIVVPDRQSDDTVRSATLTRRSDGATYLMQPQTNGSAQVYAIPKGSDSIDGIGTLAGGGTLYPTSTGWITVTEAGSGGRAQAWTAALGRGRSYPLPLTPRSVATDGRDAVCVSDLGDAGTRAAALDVGTGTVSAPSSAPGLVTAAVACWHGAPVVAGAVAASGGAGAVTVRVQRGAPARVLFSAGRVDQFVVSGDTATAVLGTEGGLRLLVVNLSTGQLTRTVAVPRLAVADDFYTDGSHWVIAGDKQAAVIDRATGAVAVIALPGRVLAS